MIYDWRYVGTTTSNIPPLDTSTGGNEPVDYYLPFKRMAEAVENLAKVMLPFARFAVAGDRNRCRAFQNRAKKRKRRRVLAKAQRKHLVAIKGKKKVGKMLAYNRRERPAK